MNRMRKDVVAICFIVNDDVQGLHCAHASRYKLSQLICVKCDVECHAGLRFRASC